MIALILRDGTTRIALPASDVEETMRPLPTTPLAGVPPYVQGVAVIRGRPVPVVGLSAMLGHGMRAPGRYATLKVGERRVALAVEEVVGVRRLDAGDDVMPPLLKDTVVAGLDELDGELLVVLRGGRVVDEAVWDAIERGVDRA